VPEPPPRGLAELVRGGQRQFTVCNACRYCEGYCAVFPALERQRLFTEGDLGYIASLCHDCRACSQACMYAEPHEWAIDIASLLGEARQVTYEEFARPRPLRALFRNATGAVIALTLASVIVVVALYLATAHASLWGRTQGPDALYRVVGEDAMLIPALIISALVAAVVAASLLAFLCAAGMTFGEALSPRNWWRATVDAATLRWLGGGGGECYYPDVERPSAVRRVLHHLLAYGFLLTFLATVSAALMQHVLGENPPYPLLSAPVLLGIVGGVAVIAAAAAFAWLDHVAGPAKASPGLDRAFLLALVLVSGTGIALLVSQKVVGFVHVVLLVHLATILMFYAILPYGKLMHATYRFGALLRNTRDARRELKGHVSAADPSPPVDAELAAAQDAV
jgi:citrate/tricarballylate utilization protein